MHKLYFVRHGQSEDNIARILSRPESPLTAEGRAQALATAEEIKRQGLTFDLVLTSTLPRAQETANIICKEIGFPLDKIESHAMFVERVWGTLTGTPHDVYYKDNKNLAAIDKAPGAEKLADLQARAGRSLQYIKERPEARILLVGHGSFGRALRRFINGQPYTDEYLPELVRYHNGEIAELI